MARIETNNLKIGMWTDGENPGAGTQNQAALGTGLNDNWKIIDNAIGGAHNSDGSHKGGVIDGLHLKSTVADGSSIMQDNVSKKLKVPDGGIGSAQLAPGAVNAAALGSASVTSAKIAAGAVTSAALADSSVATAKISDGAVTNGKLADTSITAAKLDPTLKILAAVVLYSGTTEAADTPGAGPAAAVEWQETATADVVKVRCMVFKQTGMNSIKLFGKARTSDPGQQWTATLIAADYSGSVVASASGSGNNTVYNSYAEVAVTLDISGLSGGALYEILVRFRVAGGGATAHLKQLMITANA